MSYCRFSEHSDVYVFLSDNGGWECCRCCFESRPGEAVFKKFPTIEGIIAHLREHKAAGHKVPDEAIEELKFERSNPEHADSGD